MIAVRWLALPFFASLTALGFAACNSDVSSGASAAGSGGSGGAEGTSSTGASGVPSTGSTMPEAGPLTCKGAEVSNIPKGQCDLLAQDCGLGMTCRPEPLLMANTYTTKCVNAPGIKSEGEVCYKATECRGGLDCVAGRCAPYCCPTSGLPCKGGFCGFSVQFGSYIVRACRYSQQCQVLIPDACPNGYDCHVDIDMNKTGLATCGARSGQPAAEYQTCQYTNDCGNMQQCVVGLPNQGTRCYSLCWVKPPDPKAPKGLGGCDPGESCIFADIGIDNIGFCLPQNGLPPDAGGG